MARPRIEATTPHWFDLKRYARACDMDAADWYINLAIRGEIARGKNHTWLVEFVRGTTPLIRRSGSLSDARLRSLGDVGELLRGRVPRASVEYLRTCELYYYEQKLPEPIRKFGANLDARKMMSMFNGSAPSGFTGPLDHAFDKRQLEVFVRIDLTLPDQVLMKDMQDFITRARGELSAIGGKQPHDKALRELSGRSANLKTFGKLNLLAFMDIEQWCRDESTSIKEAPLARMLDIDAKELPAARKYAKALGDGFVLQAWLIRAAREAVRKTP